MTKSIALTAIFAAALAVVMVSSSTAVFAQAKYIEKEGKVLPGLSVNSSASKYPCAQPADRKWVVACTPEEYQKNPGVGTPLYNQRNAAAIQKQKQQEKAARMKKEMDAEARAYKKMQQERKERAPTTEHCYMKNGKLVCKPA